MTLVHPVIPHITVQVCKLRTHFSGRPATYRNRRKRLCFGRESMSIRSNARTLVRGFVYATGLGAAVAYPYWVDIKFRFYSGVGKVLQFTDAESAHGWGIWLAENGLFPKDAREDASSLECVVWGKRFPNPIGLAAGFDKNAQVMGPMLDMGMGFVEIGSVTPLPQDGNPKPRIFRIPEHKAVVNRCGFNGDGVDAVAERLDAFRQSEHKGLVGVNLGVNKANAGNWKSAVSDYSVGLNKLGKYADYIVVNVSSPNTQGLRSLQSRRQFESLVKHVRNVRDNMDWGEQIPPPLFVKVAPDISEQDKKDIAKVALSFGFDGLIVSNTTISRPGATKDHAVGGETGGLSGDPLFKLSTECLRDMYRLTKGSIPIIGCGGVSSGEQAYAKIRAGACLVQLYTGLVYEGPHLIPRMKAELLECLEKDGFSSVWEAVGADHKK